MQTKKYGRSLLKQERLLDHYKYLVENNVPTELPLYMVRSKQECQKTNWPMVSMFGTLVLRKGGIRINMAKQKHYVVWEGKKPGIYLSWDECQKQVNGYPKAKYKSYDSLERAEVALKEGWQEHWGKPEEEGKGKGKESKSNHKQPVLSSSQEDIDYDSISVDVGTKGNPGPIEYKGVDTKTGEVIFYVGPIEKGTNNLGEFIAIVHALGYLKQKGSNKTVYTDSRTALSWIRNKKVASTLIRDESTKRVWELTDRAVNWLKINTYENKILKWNTEEWGEIKADFGRK